MSRFPDTEKEQLARGIAALFSRWTVLSLAIDNGWGGGDGQVKFAKFVSEIVIFVTKRKTPDRHDIEMYLADFLDDEFLTISEDGSSSEIANIIDCLRITCANEDFSIVESLVASAESSSDILTKCQGKVDDDDNGVDDCDDGVENDDECDEAGDEKQDDQTNDADDNISQLVEQISIIDTANNHKTAQASVKQPKQKVVSFQKEIEEEDGWQTATKHKKRR